MRYYSEDEPQKWLPLRAARLYMALFAMERPPETAEEQRDYDRHLWETNKSPYVTPSTDFGFAFRRALVLRSPFLIRALASGEIHARGVLHRPGVDEPEMCERLDVVWWTRTVQRNDPFLSVGDAFPVHALDWLGNAITRCKPEKIPDVVDASILSGRRAFKQISEAMILATVTNVEVDHAMLVREFEPAETKRKRERDHRQVKALREAATKVIGKDFDDLAATEASTLWGSDKARAFVLAKYQLTAFFTAVGKEDGTCFNHNAHARGYRRILFGEEK